MIVIVAASLTTAAAVAFSGIIGFVGLVTPHVIRLVWGTRLSPPAPALDHRGRRHAAPHRHRRPHRYRAARVAARRRHRPHRRTVFFISVAEGETRNVLVISEK